jgi:uncharacterized RDD family membrane protein YckC
VQSAEAHEGDAIDWSSLRYAPRERRAPGGARYAPWLQRASALLIDVSAVLTAVLTVAAPIFVLAGFRNSGPSQREAAWLTAALFSAALVVGAAYAIVLEGHSGQTFGKRALGLRVLAEDGSPCGYGRACSRELLGRVLIGGFAWLLVLPGLLSYLAALWHPQRQTWHDQIGQTIVVRVEHPDPGLHDPARGLQVVPEGERDLTASANARRLTP